MLGKLFKYEMRATGRIFLPTYLVLLAFANVFFVIYDGAVKNITLAYRNWFRPKILKKVR